MATASFYATKLVNKKIVRVTGQHCYSFLQTLLSNDIRYLFRHQNISTPCLYSFVTNTMGRCMADVFVYNPSYSSRFHSKRYLALAPFHLDKIETYGSPNDELLIECQSSMAKPLVRSLLGYKVNKHITAEVSNEMDLWAIFPQTVDDLFKAYVNEVQSCDIIITRDPRLPHLGYRLLTSLGAKTIDDLSKYLPTEVKVTNASMSKYERFRYKLGVGEGEKDFPPGFSQPLQANGDMLNAFSLRKGLFTGNDIIARNYRKGVLYRLFPIEFQIPEQLESRVMKNVLPDSRLFLNQKPVGHLKSINGTSGMAYLKINEFRSDSLPLTHPDSGLQLSAWIPSWWRKEKVSIPDGRPSNDMPLISHNTRKLIDESNNNNSNYSNLQ